MALFVTCSIISCTHSDDYWKQLKEQDKLSQGVVNVTYEHDKAMKWHAPYHNQDYLAIFNKTGDKSSISSEFIDYMMPEPIAADKHYMGRLPEYATYVAFPFVCPKDPNHYDDYYNDYRHYLMVFTDNYQKRRCDDKPDEYYFRNPTNYMCGTVTKDAGTDADLKVTMHHKTLEMNFPIHFTEKSELIKLYAVEVSTVQKSEVFTLRKHLFDTTDEVPLMGNAITMFIDDNQDTEDDFVCRINMLPFDLQGDQLQAKVYVLDNGKLKLYVSMIPLNDWGPEFKAGESYTMPIDCHTLSYQLTTSMNYSGSYLLSDDGETLEKWTGRHVIVDMQSHEQLRKVKRIAGEVGLNNASMIQLILPSGLVELEEKAFYSSTRLQTVEIPCGVQVLPKDCFYNCYNLQQCKLHEGLTTIDDYAFGRCPLETLDLPSTVKSIGEGAINMEVMSHMISRAVVPPTVTDYSGLYNCYHKKVYVPAQSVEAYQAAKYWKDCTILPIEQLNQ